ncbi:MAG: sigma-70 family RNA polymerase sigma factor [Muribaculaceae bacterium]
MDDKELVDGLIRRDNVITRQIFFVTAKPMLLSVIRRIFDVPPDYSEIVNELYTFLIENDCAKLRKFRFESSLMAWLKVVAVHFFLRNRKNIVEEKSTDTALVYPDVPSTEHVDGIDTRIDLDTLMSEMGNRRYATVIRRLVLEEIPPQQVAIEMNITVDNLYNIKRRALASLTKVALKYNR